MVEYNFNMKRNNGFVPIVLIVIVITTIAFIGSGVYVYQKNKIKYQDDTIKNQKMVDTQIISTSTKDNETENKIATTTAKIQKIKNCDNFQCLITAASQCQPISVIVAYSGLPFPLNPDMSVSGQTKYEIKKLSGVNNCSLSFSSLSTFFSISDKGRKDALASGITDTQITTQLQIMNDSFKSVAGMQTTCPSNSSAIVDYLTDQERGSFKIEVKSNLTEQTSTYTTSSGKKLVCEDTSLRQPANTSVTITDTQCSAQKGFYTGITDTGTACSENYVDIGTIIGGVKLNGKYPQCCVVK